MCSATVVFGGIDNGDPVQAHFTLEPIEGGAIDSDRTSVVQQLAQNALAIGHRRLSPDVSAHVQMSDRRMDAEEKIAVHP